MPIREKITFVTTDGKEFYEMPEAKAHQKKIDDTFETLVEAYKTKYWLNDYSMNMQGYWKVVGGATGFDMNSNQDAPLIGYFQGRLIDVLRFAVKHEDWAGYGGGGCITKIEIHPITTGG